MPSLRPFFFLFLPLAACAADASDDPVTNDENEVKVDTRTPEARRQYDANVAFASSYVSRCVRMADPNRPRVLVTGFGRFMEIANNATGRIVSTVVPSARYPETQPPPPGEVDDPAPQLSVGMATIELPNVGPVDVCGMILPVYWDLAAILIAKEVDAFQPSFVMMNGVAGPRQPIWVELGSLNRADALDDGSNQLKPAVSGDKDYAPIIESASKSEEAQPNFLSWRAVEHAARMQIQVHADQLSELLPDVKLAGFPRTTNTYLCNNVTYVTGYLMNHPGKEVKLLRASPAVRGKQNDVRVRMTNDFRSTPRVFVHWPSELADAGQEKHEAAADVMRAIIGAQVADRLPTKGDNTLADPDLQGATFF